MKGKICVLGCGPAGLLAVHAFREAGLEVDCISKKQPSKIAGAQFLHEDIPGLNLPGDGDSVLEVRNVGTREEYARKVYGDPDAPCSWDEFAGRGSAINIWYMRDVYQQLWKRYEDLVIDGLMFPSMIQKATEQYVLVVSSIPLPVLFPAGVYESVKVYIQQSFQDGDIGQDALTYNGSPDYAWYRRSVIEGWTGVEYGPGQEHEATYGWDEPPMVIQKPLRHVAFATHPRMVFVGRYGEWKKGVLVHDAYFKCQEIARQL